VTQPAENQRKRDIIREYKQQSRTASKYM